MNTVITDLNNYRCNPSQPSAQICACFNETEYKSSHMLMAEPSTYEYFQTSWAEQGHTRDLL